MRKAVKNFHNFPGWRTAPHYRFKPLTGKFVRPYRRIKELIVDRGGQQSWPTLAHKMAEELIPDDGVDHKPDKLQSRLVDTLLLPEPITLTPMSTPFIVHTTQAETSVPTPQNSLKVLMIGGRDPYKNDLARLIRTPALSAQTFQTFHGSMHKLPELSNQSNVTQTHKCGFSIL